MNAEQAIAEARAAIDKAVDEWMNQDWQPSGMDLGGNLEYDDYPASQFVLDALSVLAPLVVGEDGRIGRLEAAAKVHVRGLTGSVDEMHGFTAEPVYRVCWETE